MGTIPTLLHRARTAEARIAALEKEQDAWRDVIAVLCGDGGHYHQEHGTEATKAHALERFYALVAERDRLRAVLALPPKEA